jgi:hypothetical protein
LNGTILVMVLFSTNVGFTWGRRDTPLPEAIVRNHRTPTKINKYIRKKGGKSE